MRRRLGIDGVQVWWMDGLLWCFKVLSTIAVAAAMVAALWFASLFVAHRAQAQEQERGWQLGICVDDPDVGRKCRLVGEPLPDKILCESLKRSLQAKIVAGKVHCTRVLINAQSSRRSD